jgi:hypothetical protein
MHFSPNTCHHEQTRALELAAILRRSYGVSHDSTDDDVVLRRAAWLAAGKGQAAAQGIEATVTVLSDLASVFEELQHRFLRLHEEFLCLDDDNVTALFRGPGPLGASNAAATRAALASQACAQALSRVRQCSEALGHVSSVWVELPDPVSSAAVLEESAEAIKHFQGVADVLAAQRQAAIARAKAAIESGAFASSYSEEEDLVDTSADDENEKRQEWSLFGMWSSAVHDIEMGYRYNAQSPVWVHTQKSLEITINQLRRHYFHVPSSCNAPHTLDEIFHAFDELTHTLSRLYEEVMCFDVDADVLFSNDGTESPLTVILAAADIQKRALEWKCKFLAKPTAAQFQLLHLSTKKISVAPFLSFLEQACIVGEALDAQIVDLANHRLNLVESLKVSTEVSGYTSW